MSIEISCCDSLVFFFCTLVIILCFDLLDYGGKKHATFPGGLGLRLLQVIVLRSVLLLCYSYFRKGLCPSRIPCGHNCEKVFAV